MKKLLLFLSIFCLTKQAFGAEVKKEWERLLEQRPLDYDAILRCPDLPANWRRDISQAKDFLQTISETLPELTSNELSERMSNIKYFIHNQAYQTFLEYKKISNDKIPFYDNPFYKRLYNKFYNSLYNDFIQFESDLPEFSIKYAIKELNKLAFQRSDFPTVLMSNVSSIELERLFPNCDAFSIVIRKINKINDTIAKIKKTFIEQINFLKKYGQLKQYEQPKARL